MMLAYYRLGRFEDARRSMRRLLTFAETFRMDNPLTNFGSEVYFPDDPIHLCYDSFGPAAALVRGLFEYVYRADGLTLIPHVPPAITTLQQHFPIHFGRKRLYINTAGVGPVASVSVNGKPWRSFGAESILLPYEAIPDSAHIAINLGDSAPEARPVEPGEPAAEIAEARLAAQALVLSGSPELDAKGAKLASFRTRLVEAGLGETYEAGHAAVALETIAAIGERAQLLAAGKIRPLPDAARKAADQAYVDAAVALYQGLEGVLNRYAESPGPQQQQMHALWTK